MNGAIRRWFNRGQGSPVYVSPLILAWYNSLSVKPSALLLSDLNTLVDGIDADGNWGYLDLFGLVAGMETNEQRLRPFITTSGDDFVAVPLGSTLTLDVNGANGVAGSGYLDLMWNPADHGVQYVGANAFFSLSANVVVPGYSLQDGVLDSINTAYTLIDYTSITMSAYINDDGTSVATPTILNVENTYYMSVARIGDNVTLRKNSNTVTESWPVTPVLSPLNFYGTAGNYDNTPNGGGDTYYRHFMAGSGSANQLQIMNRLNTFYVARGFSVIPIPEILAWWTSLTIKPTDYLVAALNALVTGLIADGTWALLDLFHVMGAMETPEMVLRPLKSSSGSDFTAINSPLTTFQGIQGNGTTSYVNLNWIPSVNGVNFTQNSACFGTYNVHTGIESNKCDIGTNDGTNHIFVNYRQTGTDLVNLRINGPVTNNVTTVTSSTPTGTMSIVRTAASGAGSGSVYKKGALLGGAITLQASTGLPTKTVYLGAQNNNGTAALFGVRLSRSIHFGSGAINQVALHTRLQAYMTAVGLQV